MKTFYHLSYTLKDSNIKMQPRKGRRDTQDAADEIACICVAPSVEQALAACGYFFDIEEYNVYSCITDKAIPATFVYDFEATQEHRIYEDTEFTLLGKLKTDKYQMLSELPQITNEDVAKIIRLIGVVCLQQ